MEMIFLQLFILVFVASHIVAEAQESDSSTAFDEEERVRVLVGFHNLKEENDFVRQQQIHQRMRSSRQRKIKYRFKKTKALAMEVAKSDLEEMKKDRKFSFVEEDVLVPLAGGRVRSLNDTATTGDRARKLAESTSYGIYMIQADRTIEPDSLWDQQCAVYVCVVDSGVYLDHEDIPYSRGDGYTDGRTFGLAEGDQWYNPRGTSHGTQVGGIIMATGDNYRGVVGVISNGPRESNVCLRVGKVVSDFEGVASVSSLLEASEWCAEEAGDKPLVINLSFALDFKTAVEEGVYRKLYDEGALIVAAAGNLGDSASHSAYSYPASHDSIISVASVDADYQRSDFSQYNDKVELAGPGEEIKVLQAEGNVYTEAGGTSLASPFVTGAVAKVWAANPRCSNFQIRNAFRQTAYPLGYWVPNPEYGYGLVQARSAHDYLQQISCNTAEPTKAPSSAPTEAPTKVPSTAPTKGPTKVPITAPTKGPTKVPITAPISAPVSTRSPTNKDGETVAVVLESNQYLSKGEWVWSPSGEYVVGLDNRGSLEMRDYRQQKIWSAGISNGFRCYMQSDGNLVVRDTEKNALWSSKTSQNRGASFVISDAGQVLIYLDSHLVWFVGTHKGPSTKDLVYPIRGIFYYPLYPEAWTVRGHLPIYEPDLGFYSSNNRAVVQAHVESMDYAHIDLSIASWWGQDTKDQSRINLLMEETLAIQSDMKWSIYYEVERDDDPSVDSIRADLDYLKRSYSWHPTWGHKDGKPIIFVDNENGCEVADRWKSASNEEWFVVLKVFQGYRNCASQPQGWHQYGPGHAINQVRGHSFSISPGYWRADWETPRLPRLSQEEFCNNVQQMVSSGDPWHLITTFNDAGEGTFIEPSSNWASDTENSSKYGYYLDCLHEYH